MSNHYTRIAKLLVVIMQLLLFHGSQARLRIGDLETFIGPGVFECNMGECEFEVDPSLGIGADPCHTRTKRHMYELGELELLKPIGTML